MPDTGQLPLRDIHLPDAVSWWPPAPGWWLTPLLLILLSGLLWFLYRRRRSKGLWSREAQAELKGIEQRYEREQDSGQLIQTLSILIRRSAMSRYGREGIAGMSGEPWLAYLDSIMGQNHFQTDTGRLLIDVAWRPQPELSPQQAMDLIALTRAWLRHLSTHDGDPR